ncbi:MAG: S41 family peptidase [Acidobacteriota bacterium]
MNRRSPPRLTLVFVVALSTIACGGSRAPTQPTGPNPEQARAYLDQLIGLMQANSINRLTIDWNSFRTTVFGQAAGAQTISDTYPAIRVALGLLGDGHSSYQASTGVVIYVPNRSCSASGGSTPTLPVTIGYIKVGAFSGSGAQATTFADGIQRAIISADRDDLIGWIVDVRGNGGGNMWPMIAGVGPVLGEGLVGYFIDPTGVESPWVYRDGASWLSGYVQQRVTAPYRLRRDRPRVAVLTDNGIASSGEATVVAFRQRQDTRSFGTPTCGLSTANRSFPMSDGATLNLTVSVMADRTRAMYGDSIVPDEIVTDPGQLVQRAMAWLNSGS